MNTLIKKLLQALFGGIIVAGFGYFMGLPPVVTIGLCAALGAGIALE